MTAKNKILLPCPFCGKTPQDNVAWNLEKRQNVHLVKCLNHRCILYDLDFVAAEQWNTRKGSPLSPLQEQIKQCLEIKNL